MLVTLYNLTQALNEHSSPQTLYSLSKTLRAEGVESKEIIQSIYDYYDAHESEIEPEYEDQLDELVFVLEGKCHHSISLA